MHTQINLIATAYGECLLADFCSNLLSSPSYSEQWDPPPPVSVASPTGPAALLYMALVPVSHNPTTCS